MKITPAVLLVSILNLSVYLTTIVVLLIFNYDLRDDLSVYPTYSENFSLYRLLTFMFTHSTDFSHIFFNLLFLIIFGCYVEKKIGYRNFILFYVFCSLISFIFINHGYGTLKSDLDKKINTIKLNPLKIKMENGVARYDSDIKLSSAQSNAIKNYGYVLSKSLGSSCSVFGIVIFYFLSNLTNYRKFLFSLISGYLIFANIIGFLDVNILNSNSFYGHFGGMVIGLLFFIMCNIIKIKNPHHS